MALPPPSPSSRTTTCDSPEFEFNPSFSSPTSLHSADQLFFRGHLLPLHLLSISDQPLPTPSPEIAEPSKPDPPSDPSPSIISAGITASKRWSHVFKKNDKKPPPESEDKSKNKDSHKNRDKEKKREIRKSGANSAELNINLWPFSRSRSAGNNSTARTRPPSAATRKVSSAPCSRSNSAGDSKTRRSFPVSPLRSGGVHLGRTSPVWQLPRTSSGKVSEKGKKEAGETSRRSKIVKPAGVNKNRVLNLSVPMCIGYRHHLSCRADEASVSSGDTGGEDGAGGSRISGSNSGNLFNIRSLFTKKVY